jgi:hypothetical protein
VKELTGGEGVSVVYDSIGQDTFYGSLDCLAPLGLMVSFGNASGPVPAFAPSELQSRGSLFLTRPTMMHYTAKREDLEATARSLFGVVASGEVKIAINQRYHLPDAAQAHIDLESRAHDRLVDPGAALSRSLHLILEQSMNEKTENKPVDEDDGNPKFGRLLAVLLLALVLIVAITFGSEALFT